MCLVISTKSTSLLQLIEAPNASGKSHIDTCSVEGLPTTDTNGFTIPFTAGNFYLSLARESGGRRALETTGRNIRLGQRVLIGVMRPIDPRIEAQEEMRHPALETAAAYVPLDKSGPADEYGFARFCDETSTNRQAAFAEIRTRVEGTRPATEFNG